MIQHSRTSHLFRVSLVFLLLNIPLLSLAQDNIIFAPIGAKWSSATNSDIMQVNRDTSINGVTSRIIDREWQCFDHFKNILVPRQSMNFGMRMSQYLSTCIVLMMRCII